MYTHTCLYCGKTFESRRAAAAFCPGKSTCRAGYHKRTARERAKADKLKAESDADAMLAKLRTLDPKAAALIDKLRELSGKAECVELAIKAGLQVHETLTDAGTAVS